MNDFYKVTPEVIINLKNVVSIRKITSQQQTALIFTLSTNEKIKKHYKTVEERDEEFRNFSKYMCASFSINDTED